MVAHKLDVSVPVSVCKCFGPPLTLCPSGLRGWTQVPLAQAAWVQIPQVSHDYMYPESHVIYISAFVWHLYCFSCEHRQSAVFQCWFLFKTSIAIALLSISQHKQTSLLFKCGHRISFELPPTELGWQVDSLLLVAYAFLETTSPTCRASLGVVVANSWVLCGVCYCYTLHPEPALQLILDYFRT